MSKMNHIRKYNESNSNDWLAKMVSYAHLSSWSSNRKRDYFSKVDTVLAFDIIRKLDPKYFGLTSDKYPFEKDISFMKNDKVSNKDRYFDGYAMKMISIMSEYFFKNYPYDTILADEMRGRNSFEISKYDDEWYSIIITCDVFGQICYICDSVDGLKEVINMTSKLDFTNANYDVVDESIIPRIFGIKTKQKWYMSFGKKDSDGYKEEYKDIIINIDGPACVEKSKVSIYLDVINDISKRWSLIGNEVSVRSNYRYDGTFQTLREISKSTHVLEFYMSDSKEMDGNLPKDIADDIIEYVKTKLHDSVVYFDNSGKILKLAKHIDLRNGYVKFYLYI